MARVVMFVGSSILCCFFSFVVVYWCFFLLFFFFFFFLFLCLCSVFLFVFFFFSSRRRHTRCLSDWSSDVCSSDLLLQRLASVPSAESPDPRIADLVAAIERRELLKRGYVVSSLSVAPADRKSVV